jgi:hypothetical protein
MLLLEYLGYVALYGYMIFGAIYILSWVFRETYTLSIYTISEYTPRIGPADISILDLIFLEQEIDNIE